MKKRAILLALLCLLPIGLAAPARAETLDDDSIKVFYAGYAEALLKADNYQSFIQKRFDDKYVQQETLNRTIDNTMPETTTTAYGKDLRLLNSIRDANQTRIINAQANVLDIQYSADKKYAFVTYSLVASGLTKLPNASGVAADATFDDAEGCADQLMLKNDAITVIKSACNGNYVAKK